MVTKRKRATRHNDAMTIQAHTPIDGAEKHRTALRDEFVAKAGWSDATAAPIAGDASTRSYMRLLRQDGRAILMDAPPAAETAFCPPEATAEERVALGYNAEARLAGPNLNAFIQVAAALHGANLSAPAIFAADPTNGFALIEDLGDDLFARAIPAGADERLLYETAIDVLIGLRQAAPQPPISNDYQMQDYDMVAMAAEVDLLPEWYAPFRLGAALDNDALDSYRSLWRDLIDQLSPPSVIVLRDYHAENLLWLPDRDGQKRVGLIDFQDGLFGNPAYDLVSLLEDARRDVDPGLARDMVDRYLKANADMDAEQFRRDYAIIGAQRNAKILGIFARLIKRDGKDRYYDFLPRVERHFQNNLRHPALSPMRAFLARALPELVA